MAGRSGAPACWRCNLDTDLLDTLSLAGQQGQHGGHALAQFGRHCWRRGQQAPLTVFQGAGLHEGAQPLWKTAPYPLQTVSGRLGPLGQTREGGGRSRCLLQRHDVRCRGFAHALIMRSGWGNAGFAPQAVKIPRLSCLLALATVDRLAAIRPAPTLNRQDFRDCCRVRPPPAHPWPSIF